MFRSPVRRSRAMRPVGALLLAMAILAAHYLVQIGPADAGHEPAIAYLLSLAAFLCATAGAALLVYGPHLLDRIPLSEQWTALDRPTIDEPERREQS